MPKYRPAPGDKFRFTGATERDFPYPYALTVRPGDVVETPDNPDPNWFEPVPAHPVVAEAAPAAAEPADDEKE